MTNTHNAPERAPLSISVIGCGYLGATHAAALAHLGFEVTGIEVDPAKVAVLNEGRAPFHEPGLDALIAEGVSTQRLQFSSEISAAAGCDVHFVCVGTPQRQGSGASDLTQVDAAVDALLPHLRAGDVVVGKSTVPVGTAAALREKVLTRGAELVWNPEFLREGFAVADSLHPDRLVVGAADGAEKAVVTLEKVYATQINAGVPWLVVDLPTAELVKTSANAFLAMKISFINAVAEIADAAGADVTKLAHAIGLDDRIGSKFLRAGLGFGGGCLPKDIRSLANRADELGSKALTSLLETVDDVNLHTRQRVIEAVAAATPAGAKIAVLGAAFKPDSDDLRDSPSLALARGLCAAGYEVQICDPQGDPARIADAVPGANVSGLAGALNGAHTVVLATEWDQYRSIDPEEAKSLMAGRVAFDARNAWEPQRWQAAGFAYCGVGRR